MGKGSCPGIVMSHNTIACASWEKKKRTSCSSDSPPYFPLIRLKPGQFPSTGKKPAVYFYFCQKTVLWVEQPVNYLVPVLNGRKVFLGTHILVVYEMTCWIMLWQLSIPRQLQTGPFINRGSEIQEELQANRLRSLAAFMSAARLEYQTSWPQVKGSAPPILYIDYCIICSPLLLCNWVSEQKHN